MIKQGEKERRSFYRLNAYHLAKYHLVSVPKEKQESSLASVRDIGGGGVCLRLDKSVPVGSLIQLYINFPGISKPVPVMAKVVWIKKIWAKNNIYEAGVQFLEIEGILRDEIVGRVNIVRKRLEK